jgi:hypothetical protein
MSAVASPAYVSERDKQIARYKEAKARLLGKPTIPPVVEPSARPKTLKELLIEGGFEPNPNARSGHDIICDVSAETGVTVQQILSPCRAHNVVAARHLAIYRVARERPDYSSPHLGRLFHRDHSTVLHAIRKMEAQFRAGGQS